MDRQRVAAGIFRDQYGFDVRVKAKGQARTKRYPATADLEAMQLWQARTRAELLDRAADEATPSTRGTLTDDIARYLKQIAGRASFKSDRSHLAAWTALYGTRPRSRLTTEDVNLAIATWRTRTLAGVAAPVADKTILHRCRVLRELWHTLDGRQARHPITLAKRPKTPKPHPVDVPIATIRAVGRKLLAANQPQAYARYRVLVTTGQRAGQLMAATPLDVNLRKKLWTVRSAKGEPAHVVYLNRDMVAAWRLFTIAHAWGTYDTSQHAKLLRRCGWPKSIRPYNARHAIAFAALEAGADLGDVQGLLGHTRIETTRQYYGPLQSARQRRVSELLAGRLER